MKKLLSFFILGILAVQTLSAQGGDTPPKPIPMPDASQFSTPPPKPYGVPVPKSSSEESKPKTSSTTASSTSSTKVESSSSDVPKPIPVPTDQELQATNSATSSDGNTKTTLVYSKIVSENAVDDDSPNPVSMQMEVDEEEISERPENTETVKINDQDSKKNKSKKNKKSKSNTSSKSKKDKSKKGSSKSKKSKSSNKKDKSDQQETITPNAKPNTIEGGKMAENNTVITTETVENIAVLNGQMSVEEERSNADTSRNPVSMLPSEPAPKPSVSNTSNSNPNPYPISEPETVQVEEKQYVQINSPKTEPSKSSKSSDKKSKKKDKDKKKDNDKKKDKSKKQEDEESDEVEVIVENESGKKYMFNSPPADKTSNESNTVNNTDNNTDNSGLTEEQKKFREYLSFYNSQKIDTVKGITIKEVDLNKIMSETYNVDDDIPAFIQKFLKKESNKNFSFTRSKVYDASDETGLIRYRNYREVDHILYSDKFYVISYKHGGSDFHRHAVVVEYKKNKIINSYNLFLLNVDDKLSAQDMFGLINDGQYSITDKY